MANRVEKIYWDACMFYEVVGDEPVSAQKIAAITEILEANKLPLNGGNRVPAAEKN